MSSCFICLSNKKTLIKSDCVCKNIYVHPSCYKKWLDTCPDIFTCSICKTDVSVTFLKKFVTMEKLMLYKTHTDADEDEDEDEDGWTITNGFTAHGVLVTLDDNDDWWFETIEDMTLFTESSKREFIAIRKSNSNKSKPHNRPRFQKKSIFYIRDNDSNDIYQKHH